MKKAIIGLLLFLSVSLCFAEGAVNATKKALNDYFEVGVGYHGMIHTKTRDFTKEIQNSDGSYGKKEVTDDIVNGISSLAIDVTYIKYSFDNLGFGLYLNFLIPQEVTITEQGGAETQKWSTIPIALDLLIGPIFNIYDNEKTLVSLAAGMHGCIMPGIYDGEGDVFSYQIGVGANITCKYRFNKRLYVYARFLLGYDFYSWENWDENGEREGGGREGNFSAWNISPSIGLGFKKR